MKHQRDIFDRIHDLEGGQQKRRLSWKRIGSLFTPYWKALLIVLCCIVLDALLGLVPGYATARIIDNAIPNHDWSQLLLAIAGITLAAVLAAAVAVLKGVYGSRVGEGIMRDVRTNLITHVLRMPIDFFTRTKNGEIINRVLNDVDNIDSTVNGTFTSIVSSAVVIATTTVAMFVWNWRLALIAAIIVPLMVLPLGPIGRRIYAARKNTREKRGDLQSLVQETLSISGITLVKLFGRESFERERVHAAGTELMEMEVRLATIGLWLNAVVSALVIIGPAIIWLCGGWLSLRGAIDIGVIVAFIGYVQFRLYGSVASFMGVQAQIVSSLAVFDRIFEYLDLPIEEYSAQYSAEQMTVRGDISFENVSFAYDGADSTLKNVSIRIRPGQVAALVGASGAGKTTVTQLVPRFYDPEGGRVLIDGIDVRDIPLESLRSNIGIVTQETYLSHDTIANNLRYAKPNATDAELIAAAELVNMHDRIVALPDGYDTVVGERGHKLSGGERQRLAIARVLLKNPRILILDEATSSLDSHNESAIQSALEVAMQGRTSLVIAHRLSTIVNADLIVVLEGGKVVETGKHNSLVERSGPYARLYETQFREASRV